MQRSTGGMRADSRRFDLIVFDWDGTLVDSTAHIASALQNACADMGLTVPSERAARHVIGLGLADALKLVAPDLPAERYPELTRHYREHFLRRDAETGLFAGARELLAELRQTGYLLAVATGKTRRGLDRAFIRHEFRELFSDSRCADEGQPKPDPDMLLYLMKRLKVRPANVLMIGDTTHDIEMARQAGVAAVAVSYGAHALDDLVAADALAVVHSVEELGTWLRRNG